MNSSDSTRMSNHCCWAKPMAEPNTLLELPAGKLQERVDFLEELNRWYANELEIEAAVSTVAVRPPFPSSATSTSTVLGEVSSVQRASSTVGATS